MALIAQCIHCTDANGKLKYAKECLASLVATVDFKKNRWIIINNASSESTRTFLDMFHEEHSDKNITILHLTENIGTARGINKALYSREPRQVVIKCDDDLTWGSKGWVEELEAMITKRPEIGILGLKRDDVYGQFIKEGKLLWSHDIFGTCTAYNPLMMDKVGGLTQISNLYGFDDTIYSVRSEAAGFRNAFLPHIKITNLDKGGTEYTEWKKREAGIHIQEASIMMDMIRRGEMSYYYDGE